MGGFLWYVLVSETMIINVHNSATLRPPNLMPREAGWYLTLVRMEWLIAQRREESFTSHAVMD